MSAHGPFPNMNSTYRVPYPPHPFGGMPPPPPPGYYLPTWSNGTWIPNPKFHPGMMVGPSTQNWAPDPAWFFYGDATKPESRVRNHGDPSYWATKLSDNPLGLMSMDIRDDTPAYERHHKSQSNGVPHTPWMWVPELSRDPSDSEASSSNNTSGLQSRIVQSQHSAKALPSPPPSQPSREHVRTNTSSSNGSSSAALSEGPVIPPPISSASFADSVPQQHRQQQSQRQSDRPRPSMHHPSTQHRQSESTSSHILQQSPSKHQPLSSSQIHRSYTTPLVSSSASTPTAAAAAAARSNTVALARSNTVILARDRDVDRNSHTREMPVTFTTSIIRTPDHYSSPSREDTPHGNIYAPVTTPSRSNSISRPRRQSSAMSSASTSAATTLTASSMLGLPMSEEPRALLSPLLVAGTPPGPKTSPVQDRSPSRTPYVERGHPRAPNGFERTRSYEGERARDRERERERDMDMTPQPPKHMLPTRQSSSSQHTYSSPERSFSYPHQSSTTPPSRYGASPHSRTQPSSSSSSSSSLRTSPRDSARSRGASPLGSNPLPTPPRVNPIVETFRRQAYTNSAAPAAHQQNTHKGKRVGFWNNRGDHLYRTVRGEMFQVYAPLEYQYPDDLKQYPSPEEGWQDHRGQFVRNDPDRTIPELLDSLPLEGRSPRRPYASFIVREDQR